MQPTVQTQVQTATQSAPAADLSDFDRLMAGNYAPPEKALAVAVTIETGKRFTKVVEIMAEVEVERELDYTINVCAICRKSDCSCTPRDIIAIKKRISFPVEMAVATVISLQ